MSTASSVGLPEALERAASALPDDADDIRPANGDPVRLLELLEADAAARVLEWLLAHQPEAGAELAGAWAEDPESGAPPLLHVRSEGLPKASRKALRRAHHRLRSRGVAVPEDNPAAVVAKLPPIGDEFTAALLSAIDPVGTRAAYLVEPDPSGGARLFELLLDEVRGVVELEVYRAGRSKVRKFLRSFRERERFPTVDAPLESVRALVERIAAGQPSDRPLPRGFSEWRSSIAAPPEDSATPGELARQALGDEADAERAERLERAAQLVRQRQLGPWPPAPEMLQPPADRLEQIAEGRIIVAGHRRRAQIDDILREGLEAIYAEDFAKKTAQRFEESAYVCWKGEREEDARACLEAARAFRESPPAQNPAARAMLETMLAPILEKLDEATGEGDEPSLVVKPGEA